MRTAASLLTIVLLLTTLNSPAQPEAKRANRPRLPEGARVLQNLQYIPNGHERHKLDLYRPQQSASPLPLIIWIHGGAWQAGSKENPPAIRFLEQGYAVASINYRLSQHAVFPAQILDCKAAVRWLRTHAKDYNLDPVRFGVWGASAGGHLVALLGTTGDIKDFDTGPNLDVSSEVQAVVDFFGPTDLLNMAAQSGPNSRMDHDAPNSPESRLIGGALQKHPDLARRANPITYVSPSDSPMLLVHGDADPLVPHQQSILLHEELQRAGVASELLIVKGGGHGSGFGSEVNAKVTAFFKRYLIANAKTAPPNAK